MAKSQKKETTRERIIRTAKQLFFEQGYTATTASTICRKVGISTGNLTFHFPTKEHMLLELVKTMCAFQWDVTMVLAQKRGLLAYGLEIALQTAACEMNEVARDFYISSYTHPLTLAEIRDWDSRKAQKLFAAYNPDWGETEYIRTEEVASGIEVAVLMNPCEDKVTLDEKIACTLHNLMKIYNVPVEESDAVIREILSMDYPTLAQAMLRLLGNCVIAENEEAVTALIDEALLPVRGGDSP